MAMHPALRRSLPLSLGAAASALALVAVANPATSAPASYVALGDSYSSGTGTRTYLNDGTNCQRSVYAYPSLIATAKGYALSFRACSGAKIPDVTGGQLAALNTSTNYVTLSVGGNDAGFASVLTECALPGWMSNCNRKIDTAQSYIRNTLPSALSSLYAQVRTKAPNAKVTIVGYPRIFNGEDCNAFTWFSPQEESRLNQTADQLNALLSSQASAKGFSFANPTGAFIGHAVCDSPEWLNGLSSPISESYHPNRAGHASGYTPLVSPRLTGATITANATLLRSAAASSTKVAKDAKVHAAADRKIKPAVVSTPDLTTAAAKAAAKRAGVELASRASIDAADRLWSAREAARWAAAHGS